MGVIMKAMVRSSDLEIPSRISYRIGSLHKPTDPLNENFLKKDVIGSSSTSATPNP